MLPGPTKNQYGDFDTVDRPLTYQDIFDCFLAQTQDREKAKLMTRDYCNLMRRADEFLQRT